MAVFGRRRAAKASDFEDIAGGSRQRHGHIGRHGPDGGIVGALKSCEAVAIDVTVEDHYGYTFFIYLLDDRCERVGFVGRNDDDVKAIVGKVTNIGNLLFAIVVGRTDFNDGVFVEKHFAMNLIVHFRAPVVVATLRHTYAILIILLAARQ